MAANELTKMFSPNTLTRSTNVDGQLIVCLCWGERALCLFLTGDQNVFLRKCESVLLTRNNVLLSTAWPHHFDCGIQKVAVIMLLAIKSHLFKITESLSFVYFLKFQTCNDSEHKYSIWKQTWRWKCCMFHVVFDASGVGTGFHSLNSSYCSTFLN